VNARPKQQEEKQLMIIGSRMSGSVRLLGIIGVCVFATQAHAGCPANMDRVGPICVDRYEASVWSTRPDGRGRPRGTQFGVSADDYPCSDTGNDCSATAAHPIFAVSAPGVTPSANITWFQALQACLNVGKRLLRNDEWQAAAAGTPDDAAACNIDTGAVEPTSARTACASNWGTVNMVGNLFEWVADWSQDNSRIDQGDTASALYGNDALAGIDEALPETDRFPAALYRGGHFDDGAKAGVFALYANESPSVSKGNTGFRCAR
jgi:hypothetical protein